MQQIEGDSKTLNKSRHATRKSLRASSDTLEKGTSNMWSALGGADFI